MFGRLLARRNAARTNETTDEVPEGGDGLTARPVDRRGMLRLGGMAAAGAAGAAIASAVTASPADAAQGGNMILGQSNDAGANGTSLTSTTQDPVFFVTSSGDGTAISAACKPGAAAAALQAFGVGSGPGIEATDNFTNNFFGTGSAIKAHLDNTSNASDAVVVTNAGTGIGIRVETQSNDALISTSDSVGSGVIGIQGTGSGFSPGGAGTKGDSGPGDGVLGLTATGSGVHGVRGALSGFASLLGGVVGEANSTGVGVVGASPSGIAIKAMTTGGTGVSALSSTGAAVSATANATTSLNPAVKALSNGKGAAVLATMGASATAPAVQATTGAATTSPAVKATSGVAGQAAVQANGAAGTGAALDVHGRAMYTRSGLLNIAGTNQALTPVVVSGGLTAASHVLATLQNNSGTLAVRAAVPILTGANAGKIQIFLTGNAPGTPGVNVAWFVFG